MDARRKTYPPNYVDDGIRIVYEIVLGGSDEGGSENLQYNVLNNQQIFGKDLFQMKNLNYNDGMYNDYHHHGVLRDIMLDLYKHRVEPAVILQYFDNSITWSEIFVSFNFYRIHT